jgi:hypothetical protein
VVEVAGAETWMKKAVEEAHRQATQPVVAMVSPVAGTSDRVSPSSPAATVTAVSRPQAPALSNRKAASIPTPSVSRADMAMVDSVTMALYAAYPGVASAPPGAESLLPSI